MGSFLLMLIFTPFGSSSHSTSSCTTPGHSTRMKRLTPVLMALSKTFNMGSKLSDGLSQRRDDTTRLGGKACFFLWETYTILAQCSMSMASRVCVWLLWHKLHKRHGPRADRRFRLSGFNVDKLGQKPYSSAHSKSARTMLEPSLLPCYKL